MFQELTVSFGPQSVGTTSSYRQVRAYNLEKFVEKVASVKISGPFVETHTCTSIQPRSSCVIGVAFTPRFQGFQLGYVVVTVESPRIPKGVGRTTTLVLTGQGVPGVTVSPASLGFGAQSVGSTSGPKSVTLANNLSGPLKILQVKASGDFIAENGCGGAVAPRESCTVAVRFRPAAAGRRSGMLTITDSRMGAHFIPLTGSGRNPGSGP